jgi:uncharacterized membrane protein
MGPTRVKSRDKDHVSCWKRVRWVLYDKLTTKISEKISLEDIEIWVVAISRG